MQALAVVAHTAEAAARPRFVGCRRGKKFFAAADLKQRVIGGGKLKRLLCEKISAKK
jgi:hypothetical protein